MHPKSPFLILIHESLSFLRWHEYALNNAYILPLGIPRQQLQVTLEIKLWQLDNTILKEIQV